MECKYIDGMNVIDYSTSWKINRFKERSLNYKKIEISSELYETNTSLKYFYCINETERQLYDMKTETYKIATVLRISMKISDDVGDPKNYVYVNLAVHSDNTSAPIYSNQNLFQLTSAENGTVSLNIDIEKKDLLTEDYIINDTLTVKCIIKEIHIEENKEGFI